MSVRRLADLADISNPYLSQIERGLRKPSAEILQQIARALQISAETLYERAGFLSPGDSGCSVRDAIAADVLTNGWKPGINAFGKAYDGEDVDAASLAIGLMGLLPPDDPRFAGTIHAVETQLRRGPVVYRYLSEDGLPGREGGFLLCGFWLADAYALAGRVDEARWLFDQLVSLAGPTGLLAEEYDPDTRLALGNVPQTYSHHGLIDTALRLS